MKCKPRHGLRKISLGQPAKRGESGIDAHLLLQLCTFFDTGEN
jgi:hypothetical protein